ncbi:MAG: hypothetical protein RJA57_1403, partial [Bacteroidota bacterium]
YLNIRGFVGKPAVARKTRGDQYFFVNNRFIRSPYLHHAVMSAYQELIPSDSFPLYVLFIDLDPKVVDVNVHPTKQEIKFEDEKIIYAFVQASIRHALARFSITPALDFELDASIQQLPSIQQPFTEAKQRSASGGTLYQGFTQQHQAHLIEKSPNTGLQHWQDFYTPAPQASTPGSAEALPGETPNAPALPIEDAQRLQLLNTYIFVISDTGFHLVHQQAAHERVIYERLKSVTAARPVSTQQSLFPVTLELAPADAALMLELTPDLDQLGYRVEPFGLNTFVVQGIPADVPSGNEKQAIELLLEQYKHFRSELEYSRREKLIRALARQRAIKAGTPLDAAEMQHLLEELCRCEQPQTAPDGHPVWIAISRDQLNDLFGR